jgi:hypothetical protein
MEQWQVQVEDWQKEKRINLTKMKIIDYLKKILASWKFLIVLILILILKNNLSIYLLKKYGQEKVVEIHKVKRVGSKGTIRAFYRFYTDGKEYEGFYDNTDLKKFDSLRIVYYPKYPDINQPKKFIEDY